MLRLLFPLALCLLLHCQANAESRVRRSVIESAVRTAKATVDAAYEYSRRTSLERVKRNAAHPSDVLRLLKQPAGPSRSEVRYADYMENTIRLLSRARRGKRSINATDLISEEELEVIATLTGCSSRARVPPCKTTANLDSFRTASSVCNNRVNTRWGASNIPFVRWLPSEYSDGIAQPKGTAGAINGHVLPLVRDVSNRILATPNDQVENDTMFSFMLTIFAQLTDHDLTFTPHSPVIRSFSDGIDCDHTCAVTEPCFPVEIPLNDPRIDREDCIPFFRSAPACGSGNGGSNFGAVTVREQMNTLTSLVDAGHLYGSDEAKAHFLRNLTTDDGYLRVNTIYDDNGRALLPFVNMNTSMCATRQRITGDPNAKEVPCFLAGDERSNENIALTSLHTLFLREHNRLARLLKMKNPYWDGERIYQEARKIIGAYFQIMMYRDFLPLILGPDAIAAKLSTYPGYDESVDPSISNVFATAAYRFAHTMIHPFISRLDENYNEHPLFPTQPLHRCFMAPWRVVDEGGIDPIVRGLIGRPAKLNTQEHMLTDEVRERLFKFTHELALDLGALNMQRGRDHGLPGYNKWRKFCGLSTPQTEEELAEVLQNKQLARKILDLYGTPDNIDPWLGGVAEPFVRGGRVGPLFACLIATQFQKIRQGDSLWWENKGVFTEEQRIALRDVSLARIICDNTGITEVPRNSFQFRPRGSGYTQCEDIPEIDFSAWKEGSESPNLLFRAPAVDRVTPLL
uniref:Eosinophil peroxidase-like n=1 Tax=Salarias fasciatus TaxID=181472 RepID=A0A672JTL3_SALFA